jgi:hypothetical protein
MFVILAQFTTFVTSFAVSPRKTLVAFTLIAYTFTVIAAFDFISTSFAVFCRIQTSTVFADVFITTPTGTVDAITVTSTYQFGRIIKRTDILAKFSRTWKKTMTFVAPTVSTSGTLQGYGIVFFTATFFDISQVYSFLTCSLFFIVFSAV